MLVMIVNALLFRLAHRGEMTAPCFYPNLIANSLESLLFVYNGEMCIRDSRYRAKFVIQILCGVMLIVGGIYINNLYGILGYKVSRAEAR